MNKRIRYAGAALLMFSGCVSAKSYRREKESAYHHGRMDVLWELNERNEQIEKLQDQEFIWIGNLLKEGK